MERDWCQRCLADIPDKKTPIWEPSWCAECGLTGHHSIADADYRRQCVESSRTEIELLRDALRMALEVAGVAWEWDADLDRLLPRLIEMRRAKRAR